METLIVVLFLDTIYGTTAPPILDTGQRRRLVLLSIFNYYSIYKTEYKILNIGKLPIQSVPINHLSFARRPALAKECSPRVSASADWDNTCLFVSDTNS